MKVKIKMEFSQVPSHFYTAKDMNETMFGVSFTTDCIDSRKFISGNSYLQARIVGIT